MFCHIHSFSRDKNSKKAKIKTKHISIDYYYNMFTLENLTQIAQIYNLLYFYFGFFVFLGIDIYIF